MSLWTRFLEGRWWWCWGWRPHWGWDDNEEAIRSRLSMGDVRSFPKWHHSSSIPQLMIVHVIVDDGDIVSVWLKVEGNFFFKHKVKWSQVGIIMMMATIKCSPWTTYSNWNCRDWDLNTHSMCVWMEDSLFHTDSQWERERESCGTRILLLLFTFKETLYNNKEKGNHNESKTAEKPEGGVQDAKPDDDAWENKGRGNRK